MRVANLPGCVRVGGQLLNLSDMVLSKFGDFGLN